MTTQYVCVALLGFGLLACRKSLPDPTPPVVEPPPPVEEPPSEPPPVEEPPSEEPPAEDPPPEEPPPPRIDPAKVYDLVVSFGSPGDGTDSAAFDRLKTAIAGFSGVVHDQGRWGREGEHDECFDLAALSAKDRAAFVKKAKAAVAKSDRTTVREKSTCNDDGR